MEGDCGLEEGDEQLDAQVRLQGLAYLRWEVLAEVRAHHQNSRCSIRWATFRQDDNDTLLIISQKNRQLNLCDTKATTGSAPVQKAAARDSHDTLKLNVTHLPPSAYAKPLDFRWREICGGTCCSILLVR